MPPLRTPRVASAAAALAAALAAGCTATPGAARPVRSTPAASTAPAVSTPPPVPAPSPPCGPITRIDTPSVLPLAALRIAGNFGARTPGHATVRLEPGFPTKVVITFASRAVPEVVLTGRNCADGTPVRFCFRECSGVEARRHTPDELRHIGTTATTVTPPGPGYQLDHTGTGGYLVLPGAGRWQLVATGSGRVLATAVVETSY